MNRFYLLFGLILFPSVLFSQAISLESCYQKARAHHPLNKQRAVYDEAARLNRELSGLQNLPKIQLTGQASYQSDVTQVSIPLPGVTINPPSKDQFRLAVELTQNLYDGHIVRQNQVLNDAILSVQQAQLDVQLYGVEAIVNQTYFGALLAQEQLVLTNLLQQELKIRHEKLLAGVRNGVVLQQQADILYAEILKVEQRKTELQQNEKNALESLAWLIGEPVTSLEKPQIAPPADTLLHRPEFILFQQQQAQLVAQENIFVAKTRPKVSAFLQSGLGKPGLNMFKDTVQPFAIGGIRLNWNIWDYGELKKQQLILQGQSELLDIQAENLEHQIGLQRIQLRNDWEKYRALTQQTQTLIDLRKRIKETVIIQMENGTATANDYLVEVNAQNQAQQNLVLYQLQQQWVSAQMHTLLGE